MGSGSWFPMISSKQQLLAERDAILGDLSAVERLLQSRYKWSPLPKPARTKDDHPSVPYHQELREWIACRVEPFTLHDFHAAMAQKHGASKMNRSSIREAFKTLRKHKRIQVVARGGSHRPAVYCAATRTTS